MRSGVLSEFLVGGFIGVDLIGRILALTALMFVGGLSAGFPQGVLVMLTGALVATLAMLWRGGIPNAAGTVQDVPIAILLSALATYVATLPAPPDERVATAFFALAGASLLSGAVLWTLGRFGYANIIRVLPYPVMAGSLAASGYLMIASVAEHVLGLRVGASGWPVLAPDASGLLFLASIGFAVVMLLAQALGHAVLAPMLFMGTVAGFYLWLWQSPGNVAEMRALGFLPAPLDSAARLDRLLWPPDWVNLASFAALGEMAPSIAVASIVGCFAYLITLGGVELATRRDVDLNNELRVTGVANVLTAGVGAAPTYLSASTTILAEQLDARSRAVPVAIAAMLALGAVFADQIGQLVPSFVLTGMIVTMGLRLLLTWAVALYGQLPLIDWLTVIFIVAMTAIFGIFSAIIAGFLVSSMVFAIRYGRVSIFRRDGDGRGVRSKVDRSPSEDRVLSEHGDALMVLFLRGYLFFGSVDQLVQRVRRRLEEGPAPQMIVLDFTGVNGIDPTACTALEKVLGLCASAGTTVAATELRPDIRAVVEGAGVALNAPGGLMLTHSTDRTLEDYENGILTRYNDPAEAPSLRRFLGSALGDDPVLDQLIAHMARLELTEGQALIQAGQDSGDIYFLDQGRVSVRLVGADGQEVRVRSMGAGAVVGEIASYTGTPRTADVIVDEPSVVYALSADTIRSFDAEAPALAALVHRIMAVTLAEKITRTNAMIRDAV